jgi:nucleoside-diphosphate-sugar epimerase
MEKSRTILVTGGAGYVGSVLTPKLLRAGHHVKVLDLYAFGDDVLSEVNGHPCLEEIKGDIRDESLLDRHLRGCDAVIHLACISNDPSFELDPELGKTINYDCFFPLVDLAQKHGVRRFVYASSSSVYGIKEADDVTEDLPLEPLTDYSKYKALCEEVLLSKAKPGFTALILRPATICGYSPRLRLDLSVNILTNLAYYQRKITVFGGSQMRPNLHIQDMTDLYLQTMQWSDHLINRKIYNAGWQNLTIMKIAELVRSIVGQDVSIITTPTNDLRSYRVNSDKIQRELGWVPKHSVEHAVRDLVAAFDAGKVPNPQTDPRYFNIKTMQAMHARFRKAA